MEKECTPWNKLVNAEQISTKEHAIGALQHRLKYLVSFHQTPQQTATTNVTNQNDKHNSLVQNKSSNRNSKKVCFRFQ